MDKALGMEGGQYKVHMVLLKVKRRGALEGKILKLILMGSVKRINLAQNGEVWLVLVEKMRDFQSP
jgi:hypothetical protein